MGFILGPADRRRPRRDDRPGPDAGHRRRLVRALRARPALRPARPARPGRPAAGSGCVTEIREGIDFIVRHPTLRTAILFWGAISILTAPLVTALAVHVTRDLGVRRRRSSASSSRPMASGPCSARCSRRAGSARGRVAECSSAATSSTGVRRSSPSRSRPSIPVHGRGRVASPGIAQSMVLVTYLTLRTALFARRAARTDREHGRTISLGLQPVGLLVGGALIDLTSGLDDDRADGPGRRGRQPRLRPGRGVPHARHWQPR